MSFLEGFPIWWSKSNSFPKRSRRFILIALELPSSAEIRGRAEVVGVIPLAWPQHFDCLRRPAEAYQKSSEVRRFVCGQRSLLGDCFKLRGRVLVLFAQQLERRTCCRGDSSQTQRAMIEQEATPLRWKLGGHLA